MTTRLSSPPPLSPLQDSFESKAWRDLEWAELLARIADHAAGPLGKQRILGLKPESTVEAACESARIAAEAIEALSAGKPIPAQNVPDVRDLLEAVKRGSVAGATDLRSLRAVLRTASALREFARSQKERPALSEAVTSPAHLDELLGVLERSLTEDGDLSEAASPELRRTLRRVTETRRELVSKLEQLIGRYEGVLRDRYYAEREGRYVLPVRSDAPYRVEGIVLGSSSSGGTLYVEPLEASELGNRHKVAEAAVEREKARILADLSQRVRDDLEAIQNAVESCTTADFHAATARWASEARARAFLPCSEARMDLVAMRHPLLAGGTPEVIANDVALGTASGLVVSGPNAGGKTVALKCLGLAALMGRAGLPIPADPKSTIGWFDRVLTDFGDEQSLQKNLSTFSAHVARLAEYIGSADERTLILLDELAAGTDPDEGSALAVAVLEAMVERGAAVAITTHYDRLKDFAGRDPRFSNASVGFDLGSMRPTFRLTLGQPGPSSALAVAERFGIPLDVVARARELVPEEALRRETLLLELEAERNRLEAARRSAERDAAEHARLLSEAEDARREVREKERTKLAQEARDLMAAVRQARTTLRKATEDLKNPDLDPNAVALLERTISDAARLAVFDGPLASAARAPSPLSHVPPEEAQLNPGTPVYLERLGASATVLEAPQRGQVRVAAGAMKLTVSISEVSLDPRAGKTKERPKAPRAKAPAAAAAPALRGQSNTCDVRGLRVEDALSRVEAFVDRLISEGEAAGFVLHGHGTGALRSAVREHLTAFPFVGRVRAADREEGGEAFTVFYVDD